MAVTSFEVGSIFTVQDKASAVIAKIGKAVTALNDQTEAARLNLAKLGSFEFTALSGNIKKLTDQIANLGKSFDASVASMTTSTDAAAISVKNLAAQWLAVERGASRAAIASRAAGGGGGGGGGRNIRHGIGGGGAHPYTNYNPSGMHFGMTGGSVSGQIGAGALGYGIYHAMNVQQAAWQAAMLGAVSDKDRDSFIKQFKDLAGKESVKTGYSQEEVSKAMLDEIRLLGPKFSIQQKMALMPDLITKGAGEAQLKGSTLDETINSIIGIAHQMTAYDPDSISKLIAHFSALSAMTHQSLPEMSRSFSYNLPVLSKMGYDPYKLMDLDTMLMASGLGTKAGTWPFQFGQRLLVDPMNKKSLEAYQQGMKALGLEDAQGKRTFIGPNGQPDIMEALRIGGTNWQKLSSEEKANVSAHVFGTQGGRAFAMLDDPKVQEMIKSMPDFEKNVGSNISTYFGYMQTDKQQMRNTWQELNKVLTDMAEKVMPALNNQLKNLGTIFATVDKGTSALGGLGGMTGGALIGAVAGFMIGGPAGAGVGAAVGGALGINWGGAGKKISNAAGDLGVHIANSMPGTGVQYYTSSQLANPGHWTANMKGLSVNNADDEKFREAKQAEEENTRQLKELNEQLSKSPIGGIGYFGPGIGGNPGLINAAYTTGGGTPFNNGVYYSGANGAGGGFGGGGGGYGSRGGIMGGGGGGGGISNPGSLPMGNIMDGSPVPGGVLADAAKLAGNPTALQKYMRDAGYPKSGAWCGQFAASVVRHAGGVPPAGAALADNWKNWGTADSGPHVGDVAVRNYHVNGHGHVGFVAQVNPDGSFVMEGGNQGSIFAKRNGGYSFRTPPANVVAALNGSASKGDVSSPNLSSNVAKWLKGQSYLETRLRNSQPGPHHSATGYFQFMPKTAAEAMAQGIGDPRTGDYAAQAAKTWEYIKKNKPDAANAIASGDYSKASALLKGVWPSLPGGNQMQGPSAYAEWNRILHGEGDHTNEPTSGAMAHPSGHHVHVHTSINLDGKKVANNTMKHIVNAAQRPSTSGRLPDYVGTRPQSV